MSKGHKTSPLSDGAAHSAMEGGFAARPPKIDCPLFGKRCASVPFWTQGEDAGNGFAGFWISVQRSDRMAVCLLPGADVVIIWFEGDLQAAQETFIVEARTGLKPFHRTSGTERR